MKTAIVTGVAGQDGCYLTQLLLEKGYHVVGVARRNASLVGLATLGVYPSELISADICDPFHVTEIISSTRPDEIYNLAAQSHVGLSFKNPMQTCAVNYGGYLNILLAARKIVPHCRIYQAGTSEMFGYGIGTMADESTPLMPMSPYAISKTAAHWAGVNARYEADQFVSNGILFNHESPLRGKDFVTRKITDFAKQYAQHGGILELGNLDSVRDWGHAKDYVRAMWMMLQHNRPDDFVVATGEIKSVREFLIYAFAHLDMEIEFRGEGLGETGYINGKQMLRVSKEFYRPNDLPYLRGNASKINNVLGWKPELNTYQLVREMLQ